MEGSSGKGKRPAGSDPCFEFAKRLDAARDITRRTGVTVMPMHLYAFPQFIVNGRLHASSAADAERLAQIISRHSEPDHLVHGQNCGDIESDGMRGLCEACRAAAQRAGWKRLGVRK